jgi:PadR family transcriptional regulator, regulatory protein AphA
VAARDGQARADGAEVPAGGLAPAAQAVLGLLLIAEQQDDGGAGYGYDLARHFGPGQPLAEIIHLEPGMLYHHLKRLDRAGWVAGSLEPQGARPPRQVYRITPAGRDELRRWLAEPVARTREIRLEFLLKLYFARRLDPALAIRLVAEQAERLRRLEASLAEQLAAVAVDGEDAEERDFTRLVLDLRLAQTRAALEWLGRLDVGP